MQSGVRISLISGPMRGFVYLTSIMDLYSRKIISWVLSDTFRSKTCRKGSREGKKEEECGETIDSACRPGDPICVPRVYRSNDRNEEKLFEKSVSMR